MAKIKVGNKKDKDLDNIRDLTLKMFDQVTKMLDMSKILLDTTDNNLAINLIEEDEYTDTIQNDIIVEISNFIIMYQPNAKDLREVLGAYQLISDLERIGDTFKHFAKLLIKSDIDEKKHQKLVDKILNELGVRLMETREAYKKDDHTLAKMIAKRDGEIDQLTDDLILDVNNKLIGLDNYQEIKAYTRILLLARNFERSGDHLVNICEQISYINKGQLYHYS